MVESGMDGMFSREPAFIQPVTSTVVPDIEPALALAHRASLIQPATWTMVAVRRGVADSLMEYPKIISTYFENLQAIGQFSALAQSDFGTLNRPILHDTVPADHILALGRMVRGMNHLSHSGQLPEDLHSIFLGWAKQFDESLRFHPMVESGNVQASQLVAGEEWNRTLDAGHYQNPAVWDVFYASTASLMMYPEAFNPQVYDMSPLSALIAPRIVPDAERIREVNRDLESREWKLAGINAAGAAAVTGTLMLGMIDVGAMLPSLGYWGVVGLKAAVGAALALGAAFALVGALGMKKEIDLIRSSNWMREKSLS